MIYFSIVDIALAALIIRHLSMFVDDYHDSS
jgi:hypothetical protein